MFKIVDIEARDSDNIRHLRPGIVYEPLERVLDLPYAWVCSIGEYRSAETYAGIIRRFINYLLSRPIDPFDEKIIQNFWTYVTASDIRKWQQYRRDKLLTNKKGASHETIKKEAETLVQFLLYAHESGEKMLYNPKIKNVIIKTRFQDDFLEGIRSPTKERQKIDYSDIHLPEEIDTESNDDLQEDFDYLPNNYSYLPPHQINLALELFKDEVYQCISLAALHTGLRNFELLGIPVMTAGLGFVCNPIQLKARLDRGETTQILNVKGKGSKIREDGIPFDIETWLEIMNIWWPVYNFRKNQYEANHGELNPNVLWITKSLTPLYCPPNDKSKHKKPLSILGRAFNYVSSDQRNENNTSLSYGFRFNYYKFRHTFATSFCYEAMNTADNWDSEYWFKDITLRNELRKRMGHAKFGTTISNYISSAIEAHHLICGGDTRLHPPIGNHLAQVARNVSQL